MFETFSLQDLKGYTIRATDGDIGKVDDFYFDDDQWTIRYLVVDTGGFLTGHDVLLAPEALGDPDKTSKVFPVNLTKQQVQDSPDIDTHRPVSRQQEANLRDYYGWPYYWSGGVGPGIATGVGPMPLVTPVPVTGLNRDQDRRPINQSDMTSGEENTDNVPPEDRRSDPHLRSFDDVRGARINADNGEFGKVSDFIVEDEKWTILYMIVDTGNLFPGKKVLVSPNWVQAIDWAGHQVDVDLNVETIKNSPEYDPSQPLTQDYEQGLYRHYNKPFRR